VKRKKKIGQKGEEEIKEGLG
jgi:hypothetical protein